MSFNISLSRRAQRVRRWVLLTVLLAFLSTPIIYSVGYLNTIETTTITVKEKDHVNNDLMIYTERGEVLFVKDSFLACEFGALEKYGSIDAGKTYRVEVAGWRSKFLPSYRDLLTIEEIE